MLILNVSQKFAGKINAEEDSQENVIGIVIVLNTQIAIKDIAKLSQEEMLNVLPTNNAVQENAQKINVLK